MIDSVGQMLVPLSIAISDFWLTVFARVFVYLERADHRRFRFDGVLG